MDQMEIFEPEHRREVEQGIYLAREEEKAASLMQRIRLQSIFRTVQNHASLCLWNTTRDIDNFEGRG